MAQDAPSLQGWVRAARVHSGGSVVPEHVPEYHHMIFKICMVFLTVDFPRGTAGKRLDLKSFQGLSKAEELGPS